MTSKVIKINRIMDAMEGAGYLLAAVDANGSEVRVSYELYTTEVELEQITSMYFVEASDENVENDINLDEVEYIKIMIEK